MAQLNPYLHFKENAEEAFIFYKSVFGRGFSKITRFKDISSLDYTVSESEENKLFKLSCQLTTILF